MLGVATYTIVVSSMIMKKPRTVTSRTGQGLRFGAISDSSLLLLITQ